MSMLGSSQSVANVASLARTSLAYSRVHPKSRTVSSLAARRVPFPGFRGTVVVCFLLTWSTIRCVIEFFIVARFQSS